MPRTKILWNLLLLLSIGLAPLQGIAMDETGHADSISIDFFDCGQHADGADSCGDQACTVAAGFCCSQNVMSPLPQVLAAPGCERVLVGCRHSKPTRYRSRFEFSIYRPPIT